jgi:DNA-binding transcriptional MerR regulator
VVVNLSKSENPGKENINKNPDKGFTVKEVASFIDETPNVIRNWFKELRQYIPHEKNANGYNVYKQEGIQRFKEIKTLHREQNWSIRQIEHYFATDGESFKPEPEKTAGEMLAEEIRSLREEIQALKTDNEEIKEQLEQQKGFNQALMEQLQQHERGSLERHKRLTESLKKSMEQRKEIAAAAENPNNQTNLDKKPKRKGLFRFLLGKEE